MNDFKRELDEAEEELRYWLKYANSHRATENEKEYRLGIKKLSQAKKRREIALHLYNQSFSIPNN